MYVPSSELGLPPHTPQASAYPPLDPKGGGQNSISDEGGGDQFERLDRKPRTLYTVLCGRGRLYDLSYDRCCKSLMLAARYRISPIAPLVRIWKFCEKCLSCDLAAQNVGKDESIDAMQMLKAGDLNRGREGG